MKKITAELYEEIFKDVIRNVDDYADKAKVKKHNQAYKKIDNLLNQVKDDTPYLTNLFSTLLNHNDDKVKLSVATKCLNFNILQQQAINTLNTLHNLNTTSELDKLGIELTLKRYKK